MNTEHFVGAVSLVTLPVGSSFACAFRRLLGPVCLFLQNSRNSSSALTSLIRSSRRGSDPPLSFEGLFERVVVEKLRHPIGQDDFEPLLGLPTGMIHPLPAQKAMKAAMACTQTR